MQFHRSDVGSVSGEGGAMSTYAKDLVELRQDDPTSAELRKMAAHIIAAGLRDQRKGC
jgi:hypothetical protein